MLIRLLTLLGYYVIDRDLSWEVRGKAEDRPREVAILLRCRVILLVSYTKGTGIYIIDIRNIERHSRSHTPPQGCLVFVDKSIDEEAIKMISFDITAAAQGVFFQRLIYFLVTGSTS